MSLSNHRKLELIGAVSRGSDSVRQLDGAVLLRHGELLVSVSKSGGRIGIPFDQDTAAFLSTLGVRERAQEAVERGESNPTREPLRYALAPENGRGARSYAASDANRFLTSATAASGDLATM